MAKATPEATSLVTVGTVWHAKHHNTEVEPSEMATVEIGAEAQQVPKRVPYASAMVWLHLPRASGSALEIP